MAADHPEHRFVDSLEPTPALRRRFEAAGAEAPNLEGRLLHADLVARMFGDRSGSVGIGRFELDRLLGEGGMGKVFLARDPRLGRAVAIKVLHPGADQDRLAKEARAMARINHPHVVKVFDVGTTDGGELFIAMEWIRGTTIRDWLTQPRNWNTTLDVLCDAGRGLVAAHEAGVLHRDFKPANVLLSDDEVAKVTDFGLAGTQRGQADERNPVTLDEDATATGTVLGTPAYMAPEQRAGDHIDAAADQFSFCVVAVEALWKVRLKLDTDASELRRQLDEIGAGVANTHERSVLRALERGLAWDRSERWPTLADLLEHLRPSPLGTRWQLWLAAPVIAAGIGAAALSGGSDSAASAESLRFTPIAASARIQIADLAVADGSFELASRELEAGFDAATEAGSSLQAARAAAELIFVDGYLLASPEHGRQWARHAAASLARLEPNPAIESRMKRHIGVLEQQAGQIEAAKVHFNDALLLAQLAHGKSAPEVALILGNLGSNAYQVDDLETAREYYASGLSMLNSSEDAKPVWIAMALDDLGSTELALGDGASAERRFRDAIDLRRNFRPGHPHASVSWRLLGWSALKARRFEEAKRSYSQAVTAARAAYGDDHPSVAVLVADLAEVHLEMADFQRAEELFSQGLVTNEASVGPDHRESIRCRSGAALARKRERRGGRAQSPEATAASRSDSAAVGN